MRHVAKTLACVALVPLLACGDDAVTEPQDTNDPTPVDVPGPAASLTLSADTLRFAALGTAYPLDATVSDSNGIALVERGHVGGRGRRLRPRRGGRRGRDGGNGLGRKRE